MLLSTRDLHSCVTYTVNMLFVISWLKYIFTTNSEQASALAYTFKGYIFNVFT